MSLGFSIADICQVAQLASNVWKTLSRYKTCSKDFELLSSEITTLRTTLLAVEKILSSDYRSCSKNFEVLSSGITALRTTLLAVEEVLSSYSQARLKGISFRERAVSNHEIKLKQALESLKRYGDFTLKEGSRFKDRLRDRVWEDMERLREKMERLQNDLGSRTSESSVLVEGRIDCLFTVRADQERNPITHGMQNFCTAIVLAPNGLNTHMSSDKGFCDAFIKTILNGGLFPTLVTCLATLQKHLDPHRDFFKHLMTPCKTNAHPRPASGTEKLCWGPQANSESRTCSQYPAFPSTKLERFLQRIRKGLPYNTSSPVVLLSPLLFAPSVGALEPGCVSTHNRVSWAQALRSTQTDLISVSPSSLLNPLENQLDLTIQQLALDQPPLPLLSPRTSHRPNNYPPSHLP